MILELIYGGAGVALGAIAMRRMKPRVVEKRCTASMTNDSHHHHTGRCHGIADRRCTGEQCTWHCNANCDGECLK